MSEQPRSDATGVVVCVTIVAESILEARLIDDLAKARGAGLDNHLLLAVKVPGNDASARSKAATSE